MNNTLWRRFDRGIPLSFLLATLLASGGCGPTASHEPAKSPPVPHAAPASPSGAGSKSQSAAKTADAAARRRAKLVDRENWDVYYIGSARIGYGQTRWGSVTNDPELILAEGTLRLSVKRFGQENVSEIRISLVESATGAVRSFDSKALLGPEAAVVHGRVQGDKLFLTAESAGQSRNSEIPWPHDAGGFFALEEELLCRPMQPGERRTLRALMPIFNQIAEIELQATQIEPTELLAGRADLLRIDTVTRLPGSEPLAGTVWTDSAGETLKSVTSALDQIVYRTTKDVALGKLDRAEFDLGDSSIVRLARPISASQRSGPLAYRVSLEGGDPARVFVSDLSQRVTPVAAHTADLFVRAVRPDNPPSGSDELKEIAAAPGGEPTDAERQPSSFVESDHPLIQALAQEGAGAEQDPWRVALALERFVHNKVATKSYSQTFASAADVAKSLEGDCTEHAVLLAALLRARNVPARVAIGLVYMPASQAFGFHMWTEAFIGDRWIGLDGTLGGGGIGTGYLKLRTTSLQDATAFSSFLPVAQVLGKLKIEVLPQE